MIACVQQAETVKMVIEACKDPRNFQIAKMTFNFTIQCSRYDSLPLWRYGRDLRRKFDRDEDRQCFIES
jgi:hypothetical protein